MLTVHPCVGRFMLWGLPKDVVKDIEKTKLCGLNGIIYWYCTDFFSGVYFFSNFVFQYQ